VIDQQPRVSPDAVRGASERVRLARVVRDAALRVPGVAGTDVGPLGAFMTGADDGERLEGVSCIAAPGGGYDVSLRLVCDLVPLHPLGELVRAAVGRAAATAGIKLERVGVHFAAVSVSGER
jgi:hypothetical protein